MDLNLNDPNLPIAEYIRRCEARLREIDRSMQELAQEKQRLVLMVSAYGSMRAAIAERHTFNVRLCSTASEWTEAHVRRSIDGAPPTLPPALQGALEGSRNERILARVAMILAAGGRRRTGELAAMLEGSDCELRSANPVALLSTMMSKDGRFVASRKHGWGLAGRDDYDAEDEE